MTPEENLFACSYEQRQTQTQKWLGLEQENSALARLVKSGKENSAKPK